MQPRDLDRLEDILTACSDVIDFCADLTRDTFARDKTVRFAILHSLTIIGEAANRLSPELRERHPEVPWRRVVGLRNRLVHGYGDLDLDLVWEVARTMVPMLRGHIAAIREGLAHDE